MTNYLFPKDFTDYVESFERQPGEYSDVELLLIGKAHRNLKNADKNWAVLTEMLGVDKTPNSFRLWVLRKINQEEEMENFIDYSLEDNKKESDVEIVVNTENCNQNKDELTRELLKLKQQNNDILTSYRRIIRNESRIDTLKDCIKTSVDELNALPDVAVSDYIAEHILPVEAILLISDLHLGVECDNFYNTYNESVALQRMQKLINDTKAYCKLNNVYQLNILNLGDLIHGIIHTSARIEQEYDVVNQIMKAAEILSRTLNELQAAAPIVTYRSVTDNHSRITPNLSEHIDQESFGLLIDWYIKERLKNSNIKFIDADNYDNTFGVMTLLNGKKFAYSHGHLEKPDAAFQTFVGATRQFIDYVALAHYHNERVKNFQGCTVFINGSIVGTEQYALSKRLFSEPSQKLIIFDNNNINDISINLK